MDELKLLRGIVDDLDDKIAQLFLTRLGYVKQIAQVKKKKGLPKQDLDREGEITARIDGFATADTEKYLNELYAKIFELSKAYQKDDC